MSDDKPFQCTAPGCGQVSPLSFYSCYFESLSKLPFIWVICWTIAVFFKQLQTT